MGLRNTVQQAALTAFKAIGDIARPATYRSLTGEIVRDLDEGTSTPETVDYDLPRTVFTQFKENEIDSAVVVETDQKILFPSVDLPVQPKSADLILDENGQTWEIVRRMTDPAYALVILHVRTSK